MARTCLVGPRFVPQIEKLTPHREAKAADQNRSALWSLYIFKTYNPESQPSPPWGRGWTATRAFTSGGGPGEGVQAERAPLHKLTEQCRALVRFRFGAVAKIAGESRCTTLRAGIRSWGGVAGDSWSPLYSRLLTPSPVSPRLMKTPVARHPLPQGGEGWDFTLDFPFRSIGYLATIVETQQPRTYKTGRYAR